MSLDAQCIGLVKAPAASALPRCICGDGKLTAVRHFLAPPSGETKFTAPPNWHYERTLFRCDACGHFTSAHNLLCDDFYSGAYMDATYGDDGVARRFARVISLPPGESDNQGRVRRVIEFAESHVRVSVGDAGRSVLDVGSGLCVFPYEMKQRGWNCTAIDPDARAVAHARNRVGVEAIHSNYEAATLPRRFDVVTFNKVLEHVRDPIGFLKRSHWQVQRGGFVYLEVPDGEAAIADGPERQEFYAEHFHAFSSHSLQHLVERAGFHFTKSGRLCEPSGKFTLWAFITEPDGSSLHNLQPTNGLFGDEGMRANK